MQSNVKVSDLRDTSQIEIKIKEEPKITGRYYLLDQKHDNMECLFCCLCEGSNEYVIEESDPNFSVSTKKGYIKEESECLSRAICVCNRPFTARMKFGNEEIAVAQRPCKCCLEYFPCAENELAVINKTGRVLGYLKTDFWCGTSNLYRCSDAKISILSGEESELIYTIEGSFFQKSIFLPCFRVCCFPTVDYHILDKIGFKVGKIMNIYNGCLTECFSRTSKFGIELPKQAEEDHKILLLYAVAYLDYLRYDTPYFCLGLR